jgi:uncharacterized protein (TIGR03435 family)
MSIAPRFVLSRFALVITLTAASVTGSASLRAQNQAPETLPSFEVAAVRENTSVGRDSGLRLQPGGRFVATNAPLQRLIAEAYGNPDPLQPYRVLGPGWIETTRYDITAKSSTEWGPASAGGPPMEARWMLRSLLAERFKLAAHHEPRELAIYELVMARTDGRLGPKLRKSKLDCDAVAADRRAGVPPPPPTGPMDPPQCGSMGGPSRILSGGLSMQQFARNLSARLERPVVNKTGLDGWFDFELNWTPEQMPAGPPPPGWTPIDPNGPSFFTAIQEQLGLKLESSKAQMDVLIVDRVERPTVD